MSEQHKELFSRLERVYAQSLLELAEKDGKLDEVRAEMADIKGIIRKQPELLQLLSNRSIAVERRREVIDRIFKGRISDLTLHFLRVLNNRHRILELPGVAAAFESLIDERHGVVRVDAFVAHEMDAATATRIAGRVSEVTGRRAEMSQHIDPKLIGGLKLRIGDELIDGSVVAQLRQLSQQLADAGHVHAKEKLHTFFSN